MLKVLLQSLNPCDNRLDEPYITNTEAAPSDPIAAPKDYYSDNRLNTTTSFTFSVPADQQGTL